MSKRTFRTIIDVLLTALLIFEMFYEFTGNLLHELVGFAMFACVIVHLMLSRRWIASTFGVLGQKAVNRKRKHLKVMATLLFVDSALLIFSSIVISHTLWGLGINLAWLDVGGIWTIIHTATAYGLCVFALVHLAMHWVSMAKVLHIEYNPARRQAIGQCVNLAVGVGAIALGITGSAETADALVAASTASGAAAATGKQQAIEDAAEADEPAPQDKPYRGQLDEDAGAQERTREREQERAGEASQVEGEASSPAEEQPVEENPYVAEEQPTADASEQPESVWSDDSEAASEETWAEPEYTEESDSGWESAGICTLCHKQCSLSSPRCDLPYQYGLI